MIDIETVVANQLRLVDSVIGGITETPPSGFQTAFGRCESPIEQAYCLTLFQVPWIFAVSGDFHADLLAELPPCNRARIFVFAQQPVPPYRADFLLLGLSPDQAEPRFIIVECDGFAHHSKREHLERDQQRQAVLMQTGFKVVRFTGAMIYREPQTVVRRSLEPFDGFDAPARARGIDGWMLRRAFRQLRDWSQ